jgi:GNAT superfamily N-acetyltransferase
LWPDDPAVTFEDYLTDRRARPPSDEVHEWAIWRERDGTLAGHGSLFIWHGEDNQHIANLSISVAQPLRRQGIGRALLWPAIKTAQDNGKTLLQSWTTSHGSAGDSFLKRIGAKKVSEESHSRLTLAEFNRDLITDWLDKASALADEFELGFWAGAYPEGDIEAIMRMKEIVENSMPRDDAVRRTRSGRQSA